MDQELILNCPDKLVIKNIKFLISKYRYEGLEFSQRDLEVLHCLYQRAIERSLKDYIWKRKYLFLLCKLKQFISTIKINRSFQDCTREVWWKFPREALTYILDPRSYFGWKGDKCFYKASIVWKVRRKTLTVKSKRWMGVGYKDKGSCRKPEFDASPHWKEVAVSEKTRRESKNDFSYQYSLDDPPILW